MRVSHQELSKCFEIATSGVGSSSLDVRSGEEQLVVGIRNFCDFSGVTASWEVLAEAHEVLAILLPQKRDVFVRSGDRSGFRGEEEFSHDAAALLLIRVVLGGMELFETETFRKDGARKLLSSFPNPTKPNRFPYAETRRFWGHTHGEPQ